MNLGVVGCGLIGGSAALAWRRAFPGADISAFDTDPTALERAFDDGAITRRAASPSDAAIGADILLVATPVGMVGQVVAEAATGLSPDAIVTDVGSVKVPVLRSVAELAPGVSFVGGHPMAGTEQQGFAAARADLFAGAWWFLTPTDPGLGHAERLEPALRALGAKVVRIDPGTHDRIVAVVSHLPMLVAAALVNLAGSPILGEDPRLYAGSGFRDMTRIADSNPQLWVEICLANRSALADVLAALSDEVRRIGESLTGGDTLLGILSGAREARHRLPEKADRAALQIIAVEVPDTPGVLARVASLLGDADVNVEDIRVVHSPSGERGWFFVTVLRSSTARSIGALTAAGFIAEEILS